MDLRSFKKNKIFIFLECWSSHMQYKDISSSTYMHMQSYQSWWSVGIQWSYIFLSTLLLNRVLLHLGADFWVTYCVHLQHWALYPKQWYKTTTLHGVITERTQKINLYGCENLKVVIHKCDFVNTRGFLTDTRVLPLILYRRKIVFVWHYWKGIH